MPKKKNDLTKEKPFVSQQPSAAANVPSPPQTTPAAPSINPVPTAPSAAPIIPGTAVHVATNDSGTSIAKKIGIKTSTPSITSLLNKEKKTDEVKENTSAQVTTTYASTPFTQQSLEFVWSKYANDLKIQGKINLATSLLGRKPLLKDGANIEFTITNKTQEEVINDNKTNFLDFLRKELNNYSIQLELKMTTLEEKANLYTATDRYKFLLEKNPQLEKLRQTFDLDLEF